MKTLNCAITIGLLFVTIASQAQQLPLEDAKKIYTEYYSEDDGKFIKRSSLFDLLKNYYPPGTGLSEEILKSNPFFEIYVPAAIENSSGVSSYLKPTAQSLGGLTIPNEVLLGLTDWIIKRTKQELTIYFFEDLRDQIKAYKDLEALFPQTHRSLLSIGDEIYNYNRYLNTLRVSFQNDMRSFDVNFPKIINNHPEFFNQYPVLESTLRSGFYIAGNLKNNVHPGDILKNYPAGYLDKLPTGWKGTLQTLQLLSVSLRAGTSTVGSENESYWASPEEIGEVVRNEVAFRIYLGLVYQLVIHEYNSIPFTAGIAPQSLKSVLDNVATNFDASYSEYSSFISRIAEGAHRVSLARTAHEGRDLNGDQAFDAYFEYYTSVLDLFELAAEIGKLPYLNAIIPDISIQLNDYFDLARTASDLVFNIRRKEYSAAIANSVWIYELSTNRQKNYLDRTIDVDTSKFPAVVRQMLRYGSFLAAVSEAESPEQVEEAINNFALPPGSSKIKRSTPFNVSLNAYCGLFLGAEQIHGYTDSKKLKINSYGLSVPLGFAFSKGHRYLPFPFSELRKSKKEWSSSYFISLVDLGAVAAYRFQNDSVNEVPSIQLKHIFSPGLFWSLGFPKSPISLNLGAQLGPNLRKVTATENEFEETTYIRYSAALTVDLPMLNLYTKTSKPPKVTKGTNKSEEDKKSKKGKRSTKGEQSKEDKNAAVGKKSTEGKKSKGDKNPVDKKESREERKARDPKPPKVDD